ncbi:MAG: hypothetical protein KC729_15770, partial [Candidatus Eisenbacteria bacterium]|nr:hypothetical protein [Candidatus Eisenbacteria bacterium]
MITEAQEPAVPLVGWPSPVPPGTLCFSVGDLNEDSCFEVLRYTENIGQISALDCEGQPVTSWIYDADAMAGANDRQNILYFGDIDGDQKLEVIMLNRDEDYRMYAV